MLLRHTSDINVPVDRNFPPVKPVAKQSEFHLFPPAAHSLSNIQGSVEKQQQSATNPSPTVDQIC